MISPSYYPIIGGTESFVRQLTQKMNERGLVTDVMTFNMASKWKPESWEEYINENGFSVFRVPGYNPAQFGFHNHTLHGDLLNVHVVPKPDFSRIFGNYDIVHFHDLSDLSFPFFSCLIRNQAKHRLLHCHTLDETYCNYRRNILLRIILRKAADFYLGLSTNSKRLLMDLGIENEKLAMLPNAVDVKVFAPDLNEKVDNLVLFVARLYYSKGLHVLLEALRHVEKPVQLVVIGPYGGDPDYISSIHRMVSRINSGRVHSVTCLGAVSKEELVKWYQRASIFVCPSLIESFGIVNIEALACATPVIATKVGGIPDIIRDGVNGRLIPPNNPIALSLALNELLANKELRKSYGKKGREIVEEHFSWQVVLDELERIYNQMLATKCGYSN
jgi:glycosyltransferase involved in cell wall biosynthesis